VHFAGGAVLGPRVFTPATARPGQALQVQFPARGIAGKALWVGLRAPRAAGRQEVAGSRGDRAARRVDPRDRWVQAEIVDGSASATIELPGEWHAMHAVLLVELREGAEVVPVRAGPRLDRGAGVLGVVPVAPGPTRIVGAAGARGDDRRARRGGGVGPAGAGC
jgi:hypothetical protein